MTNRNMQTPELFLAIFIATSTNGESRREYVYKSHNNDYCVWLQEVYLINSVIVEGKL